MTEAQKLLSSMTTSYLVNPAREPHIVIDTKRVIHVPKELQRIAVQYDHSIETVTFDCPRYWDGIDMSKMYIYVNFMRQDRVKGRYLCKNVQVDSVNENIMHFTWTLEQDATLVKGKLRFLVCIMKTGEDGVLVNHWNSELNDECTVSEGMECQELPEDFYPEIITDLLTRMDNILLATDPLVLDKSLKEPGLAAEAKATGEAIANVKTETQEILDGFAANYDEKLAYLSTYVTPQMLGAKADGKTDDTSALRSAFSSGKNVYLPEGTYIVNEPLYVNVEQMTLTGGSSRSVLKAGDNFPEGEAILTFYSTNTDYISRDKRENRHGSFAVIGREQKCDGIRIGGKRNTSYEGAVEASIFSNILVADCNVAYLWGAHAYRDTLFQCDCRDNVYSLKTSDDITDSGEVFTCINCGFWNGCKLHLTCGCYFYGCTIHILGEQTISGVGETTHYLNNGYYAFQNCHFEGILRTAEEQDKARPPFLTAHNATVVLRDCDGIITGSHVTYSDCAIKTVGTSGNGIPTGIDIKGGHYKFMFARMKFEDPNASITKGNVNITGVSFKYTYDSMVLDTNIYDDSTKLCLNHNGSFDVVMGVEDLNIKAGLNIVAITEMDGRKGFMFTISQWQQTPHIAFYRKICVGEHRSLRVKGTITSNKDNVKHHINSDVGELSMFRFLDKFGNILSPLDENDQYMSFNSDGETSLTINKVFALPHGTTDILVGFDVMMGGGISSGEYRIYPDIIYELM
jgi:hypothetical protein